MTDFHKNPCKKISQILNFRPLQKLPDMGLSTNKVCYAKQIWSVKCFLTKHSLKAQLLHYLTYLKFEPYVA